MNYLTIQHLPNEILDKIFRFLVHPKDLNSCSDTCQLWKKIIKNILQSKCKLLIYLFQFTNDPRIRKLWSFFPFSDDNCVLLAGGRHYFNKRLEVFGKSSISHDNLPRLPKRISFNKLLIADNKVTVQHFITFKLT